MEQVTDLVLIGGSILAATAAYAVHWLAAKINEASQVDRIRTANLALRTLNELSKKRYTEGASDVFLYGHNDAFDALVQAFIHEGIIEE